MASERPGDFTVHQLFHTNFSGERAVRLVEDVLRADFNFRFQVFTDNEQIQARRGDDDLWKQALARVQDDAMLRRSFEQAESELLPPVCKRGIRWRRQKRRIPVLESSEALLRL